MGASLSLLGNGLRAEQRNLAMVRCKQLCPGQKIRQEPSLFHEDGRTRAGEGSSGPPEIHAQFRCSLLCSKPPHKQIILQNKDPQTEPKFASRWKCLCCIENLKVLLADLLIILVILQQRLTPSLGIASNTAMRIDKPDRKKNTSCDLAFRSFRSIKC